jgi:PAS domain S-box-containing protein
MFVTNFPVESGSDIDRVVCILQDITDRKRSEESLRESEQRLRLATQAGRMYAYDWDVLKDVVVRSSEHVKILGLTEPLRFPHQQFVDTIHLDDRATFLAAIAGLTPEHPTSEVTYRALTSDGALVWLKSNGRGFFDGEGRLQRVIGMVADVTDVKEAEEALASMTGKLIEAQEQERARIARELHDDITQRLTLLAIEFERLQNTPSEFPSRVQELRRQLTEMLSDVQSLSHELHSSKLDYLGMAAAIKGFCTELAEKHGVSIDFKDENTPKHLPKEIALCLFRVAQQALHNALKYSGMRHFEVEVSGTAEKVQLVVRDAGAGFDVEETKRRGGLGLVSMQERVNMLRGQFSVESRPGEGTKIVASVPLIAQVGRSSEGSGWKGAKAHSAGLT